eukprot:TRINITY_DN4439_c0_g1_i1.p1 TRINITY_DN4439_c0_g1~~TRINITY_DN4439_c0_g1_i1.p1  ORF type:complete len:287 (-),score=49.09 TRINITY_DN4439_c0_g1_i1:32-892(-)
MMSTSGESCGHSVNRHLRPSGSVGGMRIHGCRLDGLLPRDGACSMNGLVPAGWDASGPVNWQGVTTCELHSDPEILEEDLELYQGPQMLEPMLHTSRGNDSDSGLASEMSRPSDIPVQRAALSAVSAASPRPVPPPALPTLTRPGATFLHSLGRQVTEKGRHLHPAPAIDAVHADEQHVQDLRRLLCLELTESQLSAEAEAESLRLQCQQLAEKISQAATQDHYIVAAEPARFACRRDLRSQLRELAQEVKQLERIPASAETWRQGGEGKQSPLVWFPSPRLVRPD